MPAAMSDYYLPETLGFLVSVIVGHFAIRFAAREMWLAVDLDPDAQPLRPSPWQPEALGLVERSLFTAAILTGFEAFVAVWIALKTAAQWTSWGVDHEGMRTGRTVTGREVYVNFMLGTGLSVAFAATGAYVTLLLRDDRATPAALLVAITTAATTALALWIRHRGLQFLRRVEDEN